jgi:Flp pilus assembly protein TadD
VVAQRPGPDEVLTHEEAKAMRGLTGMLPVALMATLVVSGCATKKFVREEVQKSEAKTTGEVTRIDQALTQGESKVSGVAAQVVEVRRNPVGGRYQHFETARMGDAISPLAFPQLTLQVAYLFEDE